MAHDVVESLGPLFNSAGYIGSLNATGDQHSYTIVGISRTDYLSGNDTFKTLVSDSLDEFFPSAYYQDIVNYHNSQVVMWGLAAVSAFYAYGNSTSLSYATQTWDTVSRFQIQPEDAASGFASAINNTIPSSCNGSTTAGGVFAFPMHSIFPDASEQPTTVDGETTAAFLALSGHLYEITNDTKYLDAATSAAEFLFNHMRSGPTMMDRLNLADCQEIPMEAFTYITGFNIWGLSILATHNATWTSFLNSLIESSVPYDGWTNQAGIVTEGIPDPTIDNMQSCFKVVWIRGLYEAWERMDPTSSIAEYVKSYSYVQFNALRDLAFNPNINAYSPNWEGPPVNQLYSWGQLSALDLLNAAFVMTPTSNVASEPSSSARSTSDPGSSTASKSLSSSGSTSTSPVTHSPPSKSSKAPIIAGTVVAAVTALASGCLVAFWILRRRRKGINKTESRCTPEPFLELPAGHRRGPKGGFAVSLHEHEESLRVIAVETPQTSSSEDILNSGPVTSSTNDGLAAQQLIADLRRMLAAVDSGQVSGLGLPPQYDAGSRAGTDEPPPQYASRYGDEHDDGYDRRRGPGGTSRTRRR